MVHQDAVSAPSTTASPTYQSLDAISLEQALHDFEIANRRVLDLTQRLIDVTEERRHLRTELELLRIEHSKLQALNHENHVALQGIQASRAFLVVRALRSVRRLAAR